MQKNAEIPPTSSAILLLSTPQEAMTALTEALSARSVAVSELPWRREFRQWQSWLDAARTEFARLHRQSAQVYAMGVGLGGALALMLAEENDPEAIVTVDTPLKSPIPGENAPETCFTATVEKHLLREARENLCAITCPVLCVHRAAWAESADIILAATQSHQKARLRLNAPLTAENAPSVAEKIRQFLEKTMANEKSC